MPKLRTSEQGLSLIREFEDLRLIAYRDTGGVPTIGYGHTRNVRIGQTCTEPVALQWLEEDVAAAEDTIRGHVPETIIVSLPAPAWDALVAFAFNLGGQAFHHPKTHAPTGLMRALNARDWAEVPRQMRRWVYDNGQRLKGLERRRDAEAELWASGWVAA